MKNLIVLFVSIIILGAVFNSSNFNDNKYRMKVSDIKETGQSVSADNKFTGNYQYSVVPDTHGAIPKLTGYYDYVTNGNNVHKLWILGDTILASTDQTDSASAQTSTARRSYYQASTDGGTTWLSDRILVSPDGNSYPDIVPVIIGGSRSICMSGRQFVSGNRRGYTGADVIIGAGSFTNTLNPGAGSDNFTARLSAPNEVACGWVNLNLDSIFYARYNTTTNTYSTPVLVTGDPSNISANTRQYTAANANQNVAVSWWYSADPTKMYVKESSNNGTSFGSAVTIMTAGYMVNGDAVAPWFGADMIYKPGSTALCMAFNTLAPGNFGTAQGSKLLFWSPGINGGNPVNIADRTNVPPLSDTSWYNNSTANLQVGMTAVSHPSLAYSTSGSRLFCVFSGIQKDSVVYPTNEAYLFNDIYVSYSDNDGSTWSAPRNLTNTAAADEIYVTISRTDNTNTAITITYSLSECPGSTSFTNTTTPICKVWQVLRRYNPETGAELPIGITNISNEVPAQFSLNQNFPNPFNPSTKIRFAVPKSTNVTLEVFDITGRLVAVLAKDEFVNPGIKEVEFYGQNLSSGVYFYKLTSAQFSETKKMMLVK